MIVRRLLAATGIALVVLCATVTLAASNVTAGGAAGASTQPVLASQEAPPECTGLVSGSALVRTGSASYSGTDVLVVSSSGNDTITQTGGGYTCWVGGAGSDTFVGLLGAGDQCVVSSATPATQVLNCTIVARRP